MQELYRFNVPIFIIKEKHVSVRNPCPSVDSLKVFCFVCIARKYFLVKEGQNHCINYEQEHVNPSKTSSDQFNQPAISMSKIMNMKVDRTILVTLTWATNIDWRPNLSRNVLAMSGVGDLEAIAISIPLSFSAYNMPFTWGYNDGISRLERHSL